MKPKVYKVKYTQHFVNGLLEGLDYETETIITGRDAMKYFASWADRTKTEPTVPCGGGSGYLVTKWEIVK
jgi:hypothetical protein